MSPLASFVAGTCIGFLLCALVAHRLLSGEYRRIMGEGLDPTGKENVGE